MKKIFLIILPLLLIVGCSKPVEESTLINKDGLMYLPDSDSPYTGEVFTNYDTGEKEYQGTYENGLLIEYSYLNKDGSVKEPVNGETLIDRGGLLYEVNGQKPYTGDVFELYKDGGRKSTGSIKGGKKDRLWTGLAKETAHQLGTPLSSLIAWKEYIKSKNILNDKSIIVEIEKDLERLKIITDRFSNIGSKPIIKEEELKNLINNSIKYLKKRISKNILFTIQGENILYSVNKELFSWVIENLFKNSIDAIGESGKIKIVLHKKSNKILIDFIDNGTGIKNSNFRKIFNPGFTTKKRGWGLGLALVHRIITNYHNGKIFVLKSIKNVETIIRIEFKL